MLPEYKLVPTLPRMAWGAVIETEQQKAVVYHGLGVETRERWFVEGAWNGPFDQGGLEEATVICGTGGVLRDGEWRFYGSTDRLAPLFSLQKDGRIHVSNSHVFAMSLAGEQPDACYPFYHYDIVRIWRHGLHAMDGSLRLSSKCRLGVHFSCILKVGTNGKSKFRAHPPGAKPQDFRSYKQLLEDGLKAVLENAADPSRKSPLGSICALSKGYDTNAIAALAGKAGCRQAYSFIDPRQENPQADSGHEHAAVFGMSSEEISRLDYLEDGQLDEAEFCLMPLASQISLASMAGRLQGKILLCGNSAPFAWKDFYSKMVDQRTEPCARFISGLSQLDFRLRAGYVVFSPPAIGMEYNREIHRISRSEEMRPWSVSGDYDRPLARRIAEEAGLPRAWFGMIKRGTGHMHLASDVPFSPAGWQQYQEFLRRLLTGPCRGVLAYWKARVYLRHAVWRALGCYGYRQRRIGPISRHFLFLRGTHPRIMPWPCHYFFQWSCERLRARYAIAGNTDAALENPTSLPG